MLSEKGQTLIELIVVVAVSVIVIGALVFAIIASLRNASFSKNQAQATKYAQEGIERVRVGRDRNKAVTIAGTTEVKSWNGDIFGQGAFWDYPIYNLCGSGGLQCYFKVSQDGSLNNFASRNTFPDPGNDPELPDQFKRVIIITDSSDTTCTSLFVADYCYKVQKEVTSIVRWTDFSGPHESRLTVILRKIQ